MRPLAVLLVLVILGLAFWRPLSGWVTHHTGELQPIEVMAVIVLGFVLLRVAVARPEESSESRPQDPNTP